MDIHDAATLAYSRTLEGHSGEVLGLALAGPARGLLWTAGQDGTAVAFDLTGTRGVLRTLDMDVAAGVGTAAGDRAVLTPWYEAALNTARILDLDKGRDLFGELQPFTDCVCQIGHTAITPDGRLALAGIFEWTDDYSTAITDRGRVVGWDADTGEVTTIIDIPWEFPWPPGSPSRPTVSACSSTAPGVGLCMTLPRARRSGTTRPMWRVAGSAACPWRERLPTARCWSSSGARP